MTLHSKARYVLLLLFIFVAPFIAVSHYKPATKEVVVKDEAYYHILANEIDDHYKRLGRNTSSLVIYTTIVESVRDLNTRFPRGEFSLEDVLAIVALESGFNEKSIGKHGEKGLFQILDSTSALAAIGCCGKNPHDPRINTRMGFFVLSTKYDKYGDRKKAIISYNGVVQTDDGWCEKYWKQFLVARSVISEIVKKADRTKTVKVT